MVIDPTTDRIVTGDRVAWEKSIFGVPVQLATLNRILISSVGDFGVIDGGLRRSTDTNTVDAQFAVSEATMGYINRVCDRYRAPRALAIVHRTRIYAIP